MMNFWSMVAGAMGLAVAAWFAGMASAPKAAADKAEEKLLLHNVFFTLKEDTETTRKKLEDACKKYLVNHPGVVYFAVGPRAPELTREVNDKDYQVGLHIVFKDMASHEAYQTAETHLKFIAECKDAWKSVRVFDNYIETVHPEKKVAE